MIGWTKFKGGEVPKGYDVRLFIHKGLMIMPIEKEKLLDATEMYNAQLALNKFKKKYLK